MMLDDQKLMFNLVKMVLHREKFTLITEMVKISKQQPVFWKQVRRIFSVGYPPPCPLVVRRDTAHSDSSVSVGSGCIFTVPVT